MTVIRKPADIKKDIQEIKSQTGPLLKELVEAVIQEWLEDRPEIAKIEVYTELEYNDSDYDPRASIERIEYVLGDAIDVNTLDWRDPRCQAAEDLGRELTDLLEDYREDLTDGGDWETSWSVTSRVHSVSV